MTAEHQEELKNEIQRLLKLLKMRTAVYNIETREGTDGKAYIMELSPRGGGNRLSECLRYATGVDMMAAGQKSFFIVINRVCSRNFGFLMRLQ